jgi:hypothetical protein
VDPGVGRHGAGVVDHHVEAAGVGDRPVDEAVDIGRDGGVGDDGYDLGGDVVESRQAAVERGVVETGKREAGGALGGEAGGQGPAEPPGRACEDDDLA